MPVRIIGMIGVTPPAHSATLLVIEGAISPSFIVNFAQAHEAAGFDMVLVGSASSSAEGSWRARRLAPSVIVSGRSSARLRGATLPPQVATFDRLTSGRVALHVITGKTDAEQEGDGDFAPKAERYQRAQEPCIDEAHLGIGRSVRLPGSLLSGFAAPTDVRPPTPHPLIMFGGASRCA